MSARAWFHQTTVNSSLKITTVVKNTHCKEKNNNSGQFTLKNRDKHKNNLQNIYLQNEQMKKVIQHF